MYSGNRQTGSARGGAVRRGAAAAALHQEGPGRSEIADQNWCIGSWPYPDGKRIESIRKDGSEFRPVVLGHRHRGAPTATPRGGAGDTPAGFGGTLLQLVDGRGGRCCSASWSVASWLSPENNVSCNSELFLLCSFVTQAVD